MDGVRTTNLAWSQVRDIVDDVLQLAAKERAAHLDGLALPPELRCHIESLILCYEEADEFLEVPAICTVSADVSPDNWTGQHVGPYRLQEVIGYGGMGTVFRALRADDEYEKQVAIKVLRDEFASSFAVARFLAERQILARLEHPNIARMLDGGRTEQGFPYLVMELVEGVPIDQYCDEKRLTITERLLLFRQVCDAVQFAHKNLIIHRDLKPGNILVTKEGVPKLLDFGIAKLLSPDPLGPEQTVGWLRMLTPEFASPEQVRGDPVNTATDVYSLGVLLYILLSGHRPYRLTGNSLQILTDVVCKTEPAKPSAMLTRSETVKVQGQERPLLVTPASVSLARSDRPQKLQGRLAGDLDNITLMALRKEPQRRYSSVEEFSNDIKRHLERLPVRAHQDTLSYRATRFVQRHKVAVIFATLLLGIMVAGGTVIVHEMRLAQTQRDRAERQFNDVRELANSLIFEVHDGVRDLPGSTNVRKLIVQRALKYLDKLSGEAGSDPRLKKELAVAYERMGDVQGWSYRPNMGDSAGALKRYQTALSLWEDLAKRDLQDAGITTILANLYDKVGDVHSYRSENDAALQNYRRALTLRRSLISSGKAPADAQYTLALSYDNLGDVLVQAGQPQAALDQFREGLKLLESATRAHPECMHCRRMVSMTRSKIGFMLEKSGDLSDARNEYLSALSVSENLLKASPTNALYQRDVAFVHSNIADVLSEEHNYAAAEREDLEAVRIDEELAKTDPSDVRIIRDLIGNYRALGQTAVKLGKFESGRRYLEKSVALAEQRTKKEQDSPDALIWQAAAYRALGIFYESSAAQKEHEAITRLHDWQSARALFAKQVRVLESIPAQSKEDQAQAETDAKQEIAKCDIAIAQMRR